MNYTRNDRRSLELWKNLSVWHRRSHLYRISAGTFGPACPLRCVFLAISTRYVVYVVLSRTAALRRRICLRGDGSSPLVVSVNLRVINSDITTDLTCTPRMSKYFIRYRARSPPILPEPPRCYQQILTLFTSRRPLLGSDAYFSGPIPVGSSQNMRFTRLFRTLCSYT